MLLLLNSIAVAGIAIVLYPSLRRYSRYAALTYIGARLMEGLILVAGLLSMLVLPVIAKGQERAPEAAELLYVSAGYLQNLAYQLAMILLGLGSVPFCLLLLRRRLAPAWLALAGLAGYALLAAGAVAELCGYAVGVMLSLPGGLFELVLAGWLMARGLNHQGRLRARKG